MWTGNLDVPGSGRTTSGRLYCRDPFILPCGGLYYLYHSGGKRGILCSVSPDLENWSEPAVVFAPPEDFHGVKDLFWAPECHYWKGNFYVFTSVYSSDTDHRAISAYRAGSPLGPFEDIAGGHLSPRGWDAIDGTLYVDEAGDPWLVFVHEWTCMPDKNGAMAAARLADDFTHLISEPIQLFLARDPKWVTSGVTDGPFLYRADNGKLFMTWSNFGRDGYAVTQACSESGSLAGPWTHAETPLYAMGLRPEWTKDGGHAMFFRTFEGQWLLSFHAPNWHRENDWESLTLLPVELTGDGVKIL